VPGEYAIDPPGEEALSQFIEVADPPVCNIYARGKSPFREFANTGIFPEW
jgi:hypothetical protein